MPTTEDEWKERLRNTPRADERLLYVRDYAPELLNTKIWDEFILLYAWPRALHHALKDYWPEIMVEQKERARRVRDDYIANLPHNRENSARGSAS